MFAEEQDNRWDNVGESYFMFLDYGAELLDLELGHYDKCPAAVKTLVNLACEACNHVNCFASGLEFFGI